MDNVLINKEIRGLVEGEEITGTVFLLPMKTVVEQENREQAEM